MWRPHIDWRSSSYVGGLGSPALVGSSMYVLAVQLYCSVEGPLLTTDRPSCLSDSMYGDREAVYYVEARDNDELIVSDRSMKLSTAVVRTTAVPVEGFGAQSRTNPGDLQALNSRMQ